MKIALVHDFLTQFGGAERVLCAIHDIWPEAPVYTSIVDYKVIPMWSGGFGGWDIRTSCLDSFAPARWFTKYFTFLVPLAFEQFDLDEYDVVISSSANFAKGVITHPHQLHICYCHTPPRFLYNYPTETNKRSHWFWGPILRPLDNYLRIWDYSAAQRVDYFIANSKTVAARIKKFYGEKAKVIYPSVDIRMTPNRNSPNESEYSDKLGYYLVVGRLSKYKNVDLAIGASNRLKFLLKVVGTGREEKRLRKIAGLTVQFLGSVSDEKLEELYRNCQAVIFPVQDEDFGIVPVEAMSFGKPVIALRSGGVVESVVEGKTGVFFDSPASPAKRGGRGEPTVDSLVSVLQHFDTTSYKSSDCREQAKKFSKERFQGELKEFVESKWVEFQTKKI